MLQIAPLPHRHLSIYLYVRDKHVFLHVRGGWSAACLQPCITHGCAEYPKYSPLQLSEKKDGLYPEFSLMTYGWMDRWMNRWMDVCMSAPPSSSSLCDYIIFLCLSAYTHSLSLPNECICTPPLSCLVNGSHRELEPWGQPDLESPKDCLVWAVQPNSQEELCVRLAKQSVINLHICVQTQAQILSSGRIKTAILFIF